VRVTYNNIIIYLCVLCIFMYVGVSLLIVAFDYNIVVAIVNNGMSFGFIYLICAAFF